MLEILLLLPLCRWGIIQASLGSDGKYRKHVSGLIHEAGRHIDGNLKTPDVQAIRDVVTGIVAGEWPLKKGPVGVVGIKDIGGGIRGIGTAAGQADRVGRIAGRGSAAAADVRTVAAV